MAGLVAEATSAPAREAGLQAERTSLAWSRTLLAYLAVAAMVLKSAPLTGPAGVACALGYAVVAVVIGLRRGTRYRRDVRRLRDGAATSAVLDVLAVGVVTSALAVHSLLVLLG